MESTESRFAHLLQPIRELTKNWDIDVASELNDYLDELDEMCITFDGGKTRLNFAEAALLIQGSACIYSRKVELLHSLVYQTLEYINDKNKKRNKQAAASEEDGAGGVASGDDADDVAVFSPLDVEASDVSQKSDCNTTVSVTPLPPESLIPPETHEKQKLPLISVKGEVVCSQKDFRMNLFIPGEDGLILLTLRSAASRFLLDHQLPADIQHQEDDVAVSDAPADAAVGGADDEAGSADDFLPIEDHHMELDPEEHIDRQRGSAPSKDMIRERRQVDVNKQRREDEIQPAVNIWAFHDPYAVLKEDKPFKSGKCYRVPDGLDDGGKRKRKRAAPLQDFKSWFRGTSEPAEHKLKSGPTLTDLNYIYLSTLKDKVRTWRRINRRAGGVVSDEELRRTLLQPAEEGPEQQGEEPVDGMEHPNLLGGDDADSDVEHEAIPDDVPADLFGGGVMSPETELSYEDLVKLRVEQLVVNSRGYTQETALSRQVKDWEDLIRPELLRQEERPAFDIHEYGDWVVSSLSGVGVRRSFSSIVHGLDNFEACKYLLASLQLANDYTVEINGTAGLEDSLDTMSLTLLSTLRATDRFKTMAASSSLQ
ncbi:condensin-2 complex subunit H2 [Parambassis ranga]|uniref:Condensin-2 complex subunit H2 n=1 Tax=Parambassis ranga TaxID=210632 RepID=A0A6P7H7C3_9TELE|nr:condensin-2 complex subunit H2 [Parambassis ranga]XP_028250183.1 condensin-2 complex subunit H2 [Parambassis ranga]